MIGPTSPKTPTPFSRQVVGSIACSMPGSTRTEEGRRLVELVDEAHRHQEQAGAGVDLGTDPALEVGELDRHFAALPFARLGVLPLDLRVEEPVVVPLVAEVEDGAQEVELVLPAGVGAVVTLRGEALVEHLAVAADRQPLLDGVDLGRRRTEAGGAAAFGGRGRRALAEPHLLELGGQDVDPPRELGDVGRRCHRCRAMLRSAIRPASPPARGAPGRGRRSLQRDDRRLQLGDLGGEAIQLLRCRSGGRTAGPQCWLEVPAGSVDCANETLASASATASARALDIRPPEGDFPCMD